MITHDQAEALLQLYDDPQTLRTVMLIQQDVIAAQKAELDEMKSHIAELSAYAEKMLVLSNQHDVPRSTVFHLRTIAHEITSICRIHKCDKARKDA